MLGLANIIDGERATGREAVTLAADSFHCKGDSTNETGLHSEVAPSARSKDGPSFERAESRPKAWERKEVILMNYTKPEMTRLADAAVAICSEDSLSKTIPGSDSTNPEWQTPAAYVAEE